MGHPGPRGTGAAHVRFLHQDRDQDPGVGASRPRVRRSSVLEKALLQRTLLTGKKEPNVAANELAVEAVNHESDTLDREIRNLKTERTAARAGEQLADGHHPAPWHARGRLARIYEGDPVPDRLDQLQKGNPGGRP